MLSLFVNDLVMSILTIIWQPLYNILIDLMIEIKRPMKGNFSFILNKTYRMI